MSGNLLVRFDEGGVGRTPVSPSLLLYRPSGPLMCHRRIRSMLEDAERFISRIPSDAVGFVFLAGEKPVQPDIEVLGTYQSHAGASGGVWPSSPEISSAMLEWYSKEEKGSHPKP